MLFILEENVPQYVESDTFDENFWKQISTQIDFFSEGGLFLRIFFCRVQKDEIWYKHHGWKNKEQNKQQLF